MKQVFGLVAPQTMNCRGRGWASESGRRVCRPAQEITTPPYVIEGKYKMGLFILAEVTAMYLATRSDHQIHKRHLDSTSIK